MPTIHFAQRHIELDNGQSVLDALLADGQTIPNSCRAGACQACLMQATDGTPPAKAQQGLKDTLKADGFFLACQCHPETDLSVTLDPARARTRAVIRQTEVLAEGVLRVLIEPTDPFAYRSGQYLTLWRDRQVARSYSLASVPALDSDLIELQVRRMPNGAMSGWLFDQARPGDPVELQGPMGSCFYLPNELDGPLLMVGTGTGLAPLYGIARDALDSGHRGPIHLIHGALSGPGLYLHGPLRELADQHPNFQYHPSVLNNEDRPPDVSARPVDQLAIELAGQLGDPRAFLCGPPELVNGLRKKLFLAGLKLARIYADAFLPGKA